MTIQYVPPKSSFQLNYEAYLHSFRWRKIVRPARLWMDGHRCLLCQRGPSPGNPLNVHHTPTAYKFRGASTGEWTELFTHLADIIGEIWYTRTLCQEHHHKAHEK